MASWNPWHGCTRISPGCRNCYVYRMDAGYDRDSLVVTKTAAFDLPLQTDRSGAYRLRPDGDYVYTCFTSDFFHPAADAWRKNAWEMMRKRKDLEFFFITKRPERFYCELPPDWGSGYENVTIGCTCEDQKRADNRLPVFLELPIRHRRIMQEPMLEEIHVEKYLETFPGRIEGISCGGESGLHARLCDYEWVLATRKQCDRFGIEFSFHQTGALFKKGDRVYHIDRKYQHTQAKKAGIDLPGR